MQALQISGGLDDTHHAAALYTYLLAEFIGRIDDLLHTVHIGGEGSHKNSGVFVLLKQVVKGLAHRLLGRGEAGSLRIGGITHQSQNALLAQLGKSLQINGIAEHRGIIHLEVSGVDHHAGGRVDGKCCRIYDTVVGADKFHAELS